MFYANDVATNDAVHSSKDVVVITDLDKYRLPTLKSLDFRVEKAFTFGRTRAVFDFDVFNLLNSGTILGRQSRRAGLQLQRDHRDHEPAHRAVRRQVYVLTDR